MATMGIGEGARVVCNLYKEKEEAGKRRERRAEVLIGGEIEGILKRRRESIRREGRSRALAAGQAMPKVEERAWHRQQGR